MEKMILLKPDAFFFYFIRSYREEFLKNGDSMDGTASLRRDEDPVVWLKNVELYADKETVPSNFVCATQFIYVREADHRIVGMIQIRHELNEYLSQYGGHIGYSVRPSERRKGYAKQMLQKCLPYCKSLGMDRVLVSCIDTNIASRKTILANGGVYESTVYEPNEQINLEKYWIQL